MKKELITKFYLTYRLFIFPAIVILSSLILIVFVIFPQVSKLISDQSVQVSLTNKSKFLEVKAQTLDNYDAEDLANKVNYTLASYPSDKDYGVVIGLISNLVSQSGFSLTSMTIGNLGSKTVKSPSYAISLSVIGSRNLVNMLISNIENSIRLMRIGSISISNTKDQQTVELVLSLDILYAPVPGSFGGIDSALPDLSEKDEALLVKLAESVPVVNLTSVNVPLSPRGKVNPFE